MVTGSPPEACGDDGLSAYVIHALSACADDGLKAYAEVSGVLPRRLFCAYWMIKGRAYTPYASYFLSRPFRSANGELVATFSSLTPSSMP